MAVSSATILLVEDNKLGQEMISSLLEELGYSCKIAVNGNDALSLLKTTNFDLILMDIEMPLLNGYQTTEQIRANDNSIPIIALTAHNTDEQRKKCIASGMNTAISKPFQKEALQLLLTEQLGIYAVHQLDPLYIEATNSNSVIDLAFLLKISCGRKEFFLSMIDIFIEQNTADLQTLNDAIGKSDFDTIRLLAHKIRTSVSFVGLENKLSGQLQEMEMLGEAKKDITRIVVLFFDVFSVCTKAEEELVLVKSQEELK